MVYNFPYLKDSAFLKEFDKIKLKEQFVKIVVLNFDQTPVQEIQGRVTGGSFNLDGSSAMRRTGSINLVTDEYENNFIHTQNLLSINKKIEILIGFFNNTDSYSEYDMIWFPQGTYLIINSNISHGSGGINVALTLHDKMALLNGECGGTLPASIVLNQIEDIDEDGNVVVRQPTIYQIIQQLVNHFGGEQLGKIIISDLDNRARKAMKWIGSVPLYYYRESTGQNLEYSTFSTDYQEILNRISQYGGDPSNIQEFYYGDDVGYILTDFVYPGELISKAGDTIVSILDQIKNVLGNYEYFYDINGNFIFQQIKNYLNKSYSTFLIDEINKDNYLTDFIGGKSVYTFEDSEIITAISNSPQYQQIKNDFVVWGKRKSLSGKEIPIRYHLAIDEKPTIGNEYKVFLFTDPDDDTVKAKKPLQFSSYGAFPERGDPWNYYLDQSQSPPVIYKWTPGVGYEQTNYLLQRITSTDFRSELYLQGVQSEALGLQSNYYYTELKNEWTKLYDLQNHQFFEEVKKNPDNADFFLDFIDSNSAAGEFSIKNIGRRSSVISDDSINCIFPPNSPDVIIINLGLPIEDVNNIQEECEQKKQDYVQVRSQIYDMLWQGGSLKSAYEEIKKELYQYTSYNNQVSLTTLPIYYLEPNVRITIRDTSTGIYGDYIIKSISLPLDINGAMSISCTKALERL